MFFVFLFCFVFCATVFSPELLDVGDLPMQVTYSRSIDSPRETANSCQGHDCLVSLLLNLFATIVAAFSRHCFIYIYLFITTLFAKSIKSKHRKKGAVRELELNPHTLQPPGFGTVKGMFPGRERSSLLLANASVD